MTLMILGECGNFLAYGYAQASIIAPLGTVALVSNVILAPLMLREPFRSRDLGGIVIAIIGTVVVVVNSKENEIKVNCDDRADHFFSCCNQKCVAGFFFLFCNDFCCSFFENCCFGWYWCVLGKSETEQLQA